MGYISIYTLFCIKVHRCYTTMNWEITHFFKINYDKSFKTLFESFIFCGQNDQCILSTSRKF